MPSIINKKQQKGVTLIESLIALLVISVGLLGIAALQLTSMKQNSSALHHSKAVWIAYTMADRVRANADAFNTYVTKNINTKTGDYDEDCTSKKCNAATLVTSDADDWATEVSVLPSGQGIITGNANTMTITVLWDDEGTGATGTECGNDPEKDLTCYSVTLTQ